MPSQMAAILRAQWRVLWNFRLSERLGGVLALAMALLWYGMWAGIGAAAALALESAGPEILTVGLPWGFMAVFLYWQLAPLATTSLGSSLDLKKLLVYPIPERQLFLIEVLLRLTTGLEMILVLAGTLVGLLRNPAAPFWGPPVAVALFAAFNLLMAAGVRNLLERLFAYRRVRELLIFLIVLSAALPQLLTYTGVPPGARRFFFQNPPALGPWTAASRVALNQSAALALAALCAWTAAAWVFGRWQFHRGLRVDRADESEHRPKANGGVLEALYRLPRLLFSDPLAALVEKELRSLCRAPRFRLLLLMGFSFGFIIWLPILRGPTGELGSAESYPIFVSVYALVLLAEVVFWNVLGFDRAAARLYFAAPIPFSKVLAGKNLAAAIFVALETTVVLLVCVLVRIPITWAKAPEAYAVTLVLALYLLAAGNLTSVYHPRAVNPDHSWGRSSSGKFALVLFLIFPLVVAPVLLAYGARYAFASDAAFYGVLAFAALAGAATYWIAMESAVRAAEQRKEAILAALSEAAGPLVSE